jgi:hypothetical protein
VKENKKYENLTGYFVREKIYNFILEQGLRKGVKSGEISKHVLLERKPISSTTRAERKPISRTTRALHLKELKQQRRIYYKNGRYFPQDLTFGDMRNFANCMKNACEMMVNTTLINPLSDEELPTSIPQDTTYVEFDKSVRGISVSPSLCKTNFGKDKLSEKYLFEFANRIGAYITYILIESLRPLGQFDILTATSEDDKLKRRAFLSSDLISMAINMKSIFEDCFFEIIRSFEPSLTTLGPYFKPNKAQYFPHFELNKNDFDRLSETFRNVYPGIYKALEMKWKDEVDLKTNLVEYRQREEGLKCDHKWEETSLYKLGKYYFCAKCHEFISDNFMKYFSKPRDKKRSSMVRKLIEQMKKKSLSK